MEEAVLLSDVLCHFVYSNMTSVMEKSLLPLAFIECGLILFEDLTVDFGTSSVRGIWIFIDA